MHGLALGHVDWGTVAGQKEVAWLIRLCAGPTGALHPVLRCSPLTIRAEIYILVVWDCLR